jgi:hypothetical protein
MMIHFFDFFVVGGVLLFCVVDVSQGGVVWRVALGVFAQIMKSGGRRVVRIDYYLFLVFLARARCRIDVQISESLLASSREQAKRE